MDDLREGLMSFQETEKRFWDLTRQYQAQTITLDEYRAQIGDLRLVDKEGRSWMIQELSGQWHVFQDGQWQPAQPLGSLTTASKKTESKKRATKWFVFAGLVGIGAIGLCICAWVLISMVWKNDSAPELSRETDKEQEITSPETSTLLVPANGSLYTDEFGVNLLVPAGALEEKDEQVLLVAQEMQGDFYRKMEETLNFHTLVYQVAVDGEMDGIGKAELSFPFEGSQAVLMVIIDDQYVSLLEQQPEGGVVRVGAHLSPLTSSESQQDTGNDSTAEENSIRYALLSPKHTSGQVPRQDYPASRLAGPGSGIAMISNASPSSHSLQQKDPQDCSAGKFTRGPGYYGVHSPQEIESYCRTNPEKSVIINWNKAVEISTGKTSGVDFTQAEAELLIQEAEKLVNMFNSAGFENAKVEKRWFGYGLHIVLKAAGEPEYNLKNGVIYLPVNSARNFSAAAPPLDLVHEMAHWVQHKKYSFLRAVISNARTWWIETSAELMVMVVAPNNLDSNLQLYGRAGMTGFQKSPLQWDETLYIHAQQLWVAMCDNSSVCPLSEKTFKQAINTGSYPFTDSGNQDKLLKNLDDYALYLLDSPPRQSNTSAVKKVKMGGALNTGVGEMINIGVTQRSNFHFYEMGDVDQLKIIRDAGLLYGMASVDAQIEKGGVYPLTVASGTAWGNRTPLPAVLVIKPGPPFWLKIGDEEPVRYDGSSQYTIQPISDKLGYPIVRMIALGTGDNDRFQATVSLIDLQGDWVLSGSRLISFSNNCDDEGLELSENLVEIVEKLSHHFASRGSYTAGIVDGDLGYLFEASPGYSLVEQRGIRLLEDGEGVLDYMVTHAGSIRLDPEAIEWKMELKMTLAEQLSSNPVYQLSSFFASGPGLLLGFLFPAFTGAFWLSITGKSPQRRLLGLALVLAAVSMACILTSLDMTTLAKLDRIEYLIPIDNPPDEASSLTPIFQLTGEPVNTIIDMVLVIPEIRGIDDEVVHEAEERNCRIEIVTASTVEVYPDGVISGVDIFEDQDSWDD